MEIEQFSVCTQISIVCSTLSNTINPIHCVALAESAQVVFVTYLHHQWSDSVHTLQFDSTDEYSKTVEYEVERSTELRDIGRKLF